jgi:hypothetical protein
MMPGRNAMVMFIAVDLRNFKEWCNKNEGNRKAVALNKNHTIRLTWNDQIINGIKMGIAHGGLRKYCSDLSVGIASCCTAKSWLNL